MTLIEYQLNQLLSKRQNKKKYENKKNKERKNESFNLIFYLNIHKQYKV